MVAHSWVSYHDDDDEDDTSPASPLPSPLSSSSSSSSLRRSYILGIVLSPASVSKVFSVTEAVARVATGHKYKKNCSRNTKGLG